MTPNTQRDYIRSDELADTAVRVSDLPRLFNVPRSTIRDWITKDGIETFTHPTWDGRGTKPAAVRWGDIPLDSHPTRWKPRPIRQPH